VRPDALLGLLEQVAAGEASPADALRTLAWLPIEPIGGNGSEAQPAFVRVDHHRALRNGIPEVVFGEGKTAEQALRICTRLADRSGAFLVTRADEAMRAALTAAFPEAIENAPARTVYLRSAPAEPDAAAAGPVLVASAGTADLPVAEEAAVTLEALGQPAERLYDVGVAGLHRLLGSTDVLERASVVIAVAGMEGALPSVLGGLVRAPVIAVPTSVGYGTSYGGLAALLAMLNSCAAGVTVVNVDNGFGAACAATRILQFATRGR
jgi:pyridinium-3,5-biscarboxylic acid mononucleotide synthase